MALPLTFQNRVAIARRLPGGDGRLSTRLREVLGELEMKEIKDSVSTIVSVARYTEEQYRLFCNLAETETRNQKSLNQKLFKPLQGETEATRTEVLKEAIEKGQHAACQWLEKQKKQAALKQVFIGETQSNSWEDACQKMPVKSKIISAQ